MTGNPDDFRRNFGVDTGYSLQPSAPTADSQRVIKANGGRFIDTVAHKHRYWVPTS